MAKNNTLKALGVLGLIVLCDLLTYLQSSPPVEQSLWIPISVGGLAIGSLVLVVRGMHAER